MSELFENDASKAARKRLTNACRTKDTSVRLAWAITVGEAILLGVVAVALMDYWLMLPVWMRSLAAAVLALLACLGVYRLVSFFTRPTPLKEAALDMEAAKPELGCEISTAAEYLSGERRVTQEYEPELVAALETKAAERLARAQLPYQRRLLRPALILGVTLVGLLGFILAAPASFTALLRAALPFSSIRYTHVQVMPGSVEVPVGRDLEVTNIFTGRTPKDPQIEWQAPGDTAWQAAPLITRSSEGAYLYSLHDLRTDLRYRVKGNDAVSEVYEIKTYLPPEVNELSVRIDPPPYTGLKPSLQNSPEISAIRASTVHIQIAPSVKLSAAKLRFSKGPEVPLQPGAEGWWTASLRVLEDTDYWIELVDEKGRPGGDGQAHPIQAIHDTPPRVEIEEPGQDMRASTTNKVPLTILVADDFGVADVQVVFRKLGGTAQAVAATTELNDRGQVVASVELDLSDLDLEDHQVVAYHAEARDNNSLDGPGLGKSPVYFIEITNLEGASAQPKAQGQSVNLLTLQKQIIADTEAMPATTASERFDALAVRQRDTRALAEVYLNSLAGASAAAEAITEMQAAIREMEQASGSLSTRQSAQALSSEERALAHLYQVLKHLPELGEMPTQLEPNQPPPSDQIAVVLEAIKQKQKEQPEHQALEDALQQAENLARSQATLNAAIGTAQRASGEGQAKGLGGGPGQPNDQEPNPGERQPQSAGPELSQNAGAEPSQTDQTAQAQPERQGQSPDQPGAMSQAKGVGQGQGQGPGQGGGNGEPTQESSAEHMAQEGQPTDPAALAEQELQLSQQAAALAEKLARLAGKDKRLGHNAGQNARLGGEKLARASEEIKKGNFGAAGVYGYQGEAALRKVTALLERIVKGRPDLSDVSNEDAPKEYEGLISDYFKRLSHAE